MGSPTNRRYSTDHVWAQKDLASDEATFGVTEYYISQVGGLVSVGDLSPKDTNLTSGQNMGVMIGSSSNADFLAPMGGVVTDREEHLLDIAEVSAHPYATSSWFITITNAKQTEYEKLLSADDYDEYLKSLKT